MVHKPTNEKIIASLLEKYFEGETSLEEEKILRDHFSSGGTTPAGMEYAAGMFFYFLSASAEKGRTHLMTDIMKNHCPSNDEPSGEIDAASKKITLDGGRRTLRMVVCSVAAAAAMVAIAFLVDLQSSAIPQSEQTIYCYVDGEPVTDLETAKAYTMNALDNLKDAFQFPAQEFENALEDFEKLTHITTVLRSMNE